MKFSRRSLLGVGALGTGAAALGMPLSLPLATSRRHEARNIIFCVSDGMSVQTLAMADHFRRMQGEKGSYWPWLMNQDFALTGLQDVRSLSSLVTDSAAASSAWGSGRKAWNGMINEYPDGTKLKTLCQVMKEAGVAVGVVTTATVTHATPAGFVVNCADRDMEGLIAEKYLESGIDVFMGGGAKFFDPSQRADKRDLLAEFAKAGYEVVTTRDQALACQEKKVLGLFDDGHLPYTVDRAHDASLAAKVPSLAEMSQLATQKLQGSKGGFLLQIEGARVDHAGHANDLAGMLWDQLDFEDAVKVAVEFAMNDGETLVVVTADHATGGVSVNGVGSEYFDSTEAFAKVAGMKASYSTLFKSLGKTFTSEDLRDSVKEKLAIELTADEAKAVADASQGRSPLVLSNHHKTASSVLGQMLGNHTAVTWTSGNHTAEHMLFTALGPGTDHVANVRLNTDFFDALLAAKGLKHSNPTMEFDEALRHHQSKKADKPDQAEAAFGVHW